MFSLCRSGKEAAASDGAADALGCGRGSAGAEERKPAAGEGEAQPGDPDPPHEDGQDELQKFKLWSPDLYRTLNRTINSYLNPLPTGPSVQLDRHTRH